MIQLLISLGSIIMSGALMVSFWISASHDGTLYPMAFTVIALGLADLAPTRLPKGLSRT